MQVKPKGLNSLTLRLPAAAWFFPFHSLHSWMKILGLVTFAVLTFVEQTFADYSSKQLILESYYTAFVVDFLKSAEVFKVQFVFCFHFVPSFLLSKIWRFRCETLKPFFSKQARASYYHGILAATAMSFIRLCTCVSKFSRLRINLRRPGKTIVKGL